MRSSLIWLTIASLMLLSGCGVSSRQAQPSSVKPKTIISTAIPSGSVIPLPYAARPEMRAAWIATIYGLDWPQRPESTEAGWRHQQEKLIKTLDELKALGINTVFFQVRNRGDMIVPNAPEPFCTEITGSRTLHPSYDPLAFAITECHKRGMQLHAWMVMIPIGSDKIVRQQGRESVAYRKQGLSVLFNKQWYLNPGNPETGAYLAELCGWVAKRYDIDGIHLDYIRYPDKHQGFPDGEWYRRYGGGKKIEQWRMDNITTIVKHISQHVHSIKKHVAISAAPLGKLRKLPEYPNITWTCRESVYQDPVEWAMKGYVDFLTPMMYYIGDHFYPFADDWERSLPGFPIIPGLALYRIYDGSGFKVKDINDQIRRIKHGSLSGVAFYREENLRHDMMLKNMIIRELSYEVRPIPFSFLAVEKLHAPAQPTVDRTPEGGLYIHWPKVKGAYRYNLLWAVVKGNTNDRPRYELLSVGLSTNGYIINASELPKNYHKLFFQVEAVNRAFVTSPLSREAVY